jgi:hypothetical protein
MAADRAKDPKRVAGPWPTPIGMGALAGYGDFEAAKVRQEAHKRESEAFDRGEIKTINERLASRDSD